MSTVFLGIDHGFEFGDPVLFETMVFGAVGKWKFFQKRYASFSSAERGHRLVTGSIRRAHAAKLSRVKWIAWAAAGVVVSMLLFAGRARADDTAVTDELLDAVYWNESKMGTDVRARLKKKSGELGGYQVRPGTFDMVGKAFPDLIRGRSHSALAWNDGFGRRVAAAYLELNRRALVRRGFTPTAEMLLATYNAGDGIYRTNTKVGPDVQAYIDSGMKRIK